MKLKMAENSLFAILLRSKWWISIAIAAVIGLIAFAALPKRFALFGASAMVPFLIIGGIAAVRQARVPGAARAAQTMAIVQAMSWREFADAIEDAFRRDGASVVRSDSQAYDFELTRGGKTALVSCKRWKAASLGVETLRNLHTAMREHEAQEGICIATGELTDNARRFADEHGLRVVQGTALAQLLDATLAEKKQKG
jgi:restriction system protein